MTSNFFFFFFFFFLGGEGWTRLRVKGAGFIKLSALVRRGTILTILTQLLDIRHTGEMTRLRVKGVSLSTLSAEV